MRSGRRRWLLLRGATRSSCVAGIRAAHRVECIQDCAGTPNGLATPDECGQLCFSRHALCAVWAVGRPVNWSMHCVVCWF